MFQKTELKRLFPLGIFWGGYTIIFLVWRVSFFYTLPFLLGFLVAAALQPGVAFLQRRFHVQRGPASALLAALALGTAIGSSDSSIAKTKVRVVALWNLFSCIDASFLD